MARKLFKLISFCDCVEVLREEVRHKCGYFYLSDSEHTSVCYCCKTRLFLRFLSKMMQLLADSGKLSLFLENGMTSGKFERVGKLNKSNSRVSFSIIRHLNAFSDIYEVKPIIQDWEFDMDTLNLELLDEEEKN